MARKNNRVVTYLNDDDHDRFEALCEDMGLDPAGVARFCIRQQLQAEEANNE